MIVLNFIETGMKEIFGGGEFERYQDNKRRYQ